MLGTGSSPRRSWRAITWRLIGATAHRPPLAHAQAALGRRPQVGSPASVFGAISRTSGARGGPKAVTYKASSHGVTVHAQLFEAPADPRAPPLFMLHVVAAR